jgi:hypothetical protein
VFPPLRPLRAELLRTVLLRPRPREVLAFFLRAPALAPRPAADREPEALRRALEAPRPVALRPPDDFDPALRDRVDPPLVDELRPLRKLVLRAELRLARPREPLALLLRELPLEAERDVLARGELEPAVRDPLDREPAERDALDRAPALEPVPPEREPEAAVREPDRAPERAEVPRELDREPEPRLGALSPAPEPPRLPPP